ncbi:MAG: SDR family oxidoreductase [Trueperaceae bacterium]|nr:SDR family oxidoreductase [Trueperaceae bacterium]
MDVKGKVALVTGAGSGIGAASAKKLAEAGAKVALLSRSEDDLNKVAKAIQGDTLVVAGDISKEDDIKRAYKTIEESWGNLDIVFANAGINGVWTPLDELELSEWQKTIDINLTGTFLTLKHALPLLKKQGGSVIITSSVNGTRIFSNSGASAYATSKAAQLAFGQMMALELAQFKIRVNVICPGAISTDISSSTEQRNLDKVKIPVDFPKGKIPLTGGKAGSSEQVADLVLFLASDSSSHITGTPIWIDGSQSLLQG